MSSDSKNAAYYLHGIIIEVEKVRDAIVFPQLKKRTVALISFSLAGIRAVEFGWCYPVPTRNYISPVIDPEPEYCQEHYYKIVDQTEVAILLAREFDLTENESREIHRRAVLMAEKAIKHFNSERIANRSRRSIWARFRS